MPATPTLNTFIPDQTITAAHHNFNFAALKDTIDNYAVLKDVAGTISAVMTFFNAPIFSNGASITAGGLTVTAGGITVTAGSVTVASSNVAITAGNLTFGAASARIVPGATSLLFRDNANAATTLEILNSGAVAALLSLTAPTVTGSTTVTGATVSATTKFGFGATAAGKIVGGSSSITIRNAADTRDAFSIADQSSIIFSNSTDLQTVFLGRSMATNSATGWTVLPSCAGTPNPASPTSVAFAYDTSANKLWVYNGSWRSVALT